MTNHSLISAKRRSLRGLSSLTGARPQGGTAIRVTTAGKSIKEKVIQGSTWTEPKQP